MANSSLEFIAIVKKRNKKGKLFTNYKLYKFKVYIRRAFLFFYVQVRNFFTNKFYNEIILLLVYDMLVINF